MRENLEGVQAGDDVLVEGHWGESHIARVERLTPKQVVLVGGARYWIQGGDAVGSTSERWYRTSIRRVTEADRAKLRRAQAIRELNNVLANNRDFPAAITTGAIEAAVRLLTETKAQPTETDNVNAS